MTSSVAVFPPGFRVTDANDLPISGATVEFYGAGTLTPKTVYSDIDLTVPIGTSLVADAGGYPSSGGNKVLVYTNTAPYKIILKDAAGVTFATHDNVRGAVDASGTGGTGGTNSSFGLNVGNVILTLNLAPAAGFIRLTDAAQTLSKTTYPDLNAWASAQGYPWGSASTTFNIPAAGGYFLRFGSSGATIDPDGPRAAGSVQDDRTKAHTHAATSTSTSTATSTAIGASGVTDGNWNTGGGSRTIQSLVSGTGTRDTVTPTITAATTTTTTVANSSSDSETRAKNVVMFADMLAVPALVSTGLVGANGFAYQFITSTSPTDVVAGKIGFNNATLTSATTFAISETDYLGSNLAAVLQQIPSGSTAYITKVGAPATFVHFVLTSTATDAGTYDSFTISGVVKSTTSFANGDTVSMQVMRSGTITAASGWTAGTGTATRTTFATSSVTLPVLAEHLKALIDDLLAAGVIKA